MISLHLVVHVTFPAFTCLFETLCLWQRWIHSASTTLLFFGEEAGEPADRKHLFKRQIRKSDNQCEFVLCLSSRLDNVYYITSYGIHCVMAHSVFRVSKPPPLAASPALA